MLNWNQYCYDNSLGTPFSCRASACNASTLHSKDKTSWELLTRLQLWF